MEMVILYKGRKEAYIQSLKDLHVGRYADANTRHTVAAASRNHY